MPLQYTHHESISLRKHPEFSEAWLHERIKDDSSILGLGDLDLIAHEKVQCSGGRLDMLLADTDNNVRYEVEIMLGATDPSHIIRCIEYWDVERRRYPAYDHVAVLVAEEVTSRFLNVMSLLSGSIPLIAIQLNALKVGDQIVLDFTKVLDQRDLRVDDTAESAEEDADRSTWEAKVGQTTLVLCDQILAIINQKMDPPLSLHYKKRHIGQVSNGTVRIIAGFHPRKSWVRMGVDVTNSHDWQQRLEEAGMPANVMKNGRMRITIKPDDLASHKDLIRELLHQAVEESNT